MILILNYDLLANNKSALKHKQSIFGINLEEDHSGASKQTQNIANKNFKPYIAIICKEKSL